MSMNLCQNLTRAVSIYFVIHQLLSINNFRSRAIDLNTSRHVTSRNFSEILSLSTRAKWLLVVAKDLFAF